jgi:hypothetical protein
MRESSEGMRAGMHQTQVFGPGLAQDRLLCLVMIGSGFLFLGMFIF